MSHRTVVSVGYIIILSTHNTHMSEEQYMKDLSIFQNRLNNFMEVEGLNLTGLAKKIGCSYQAITLWFEGKYYPRYNVLISIADYFECSVDYLLGLTDNESFKPSNNISDFQTRFIAALKKNDFTEYRVAKLCRIEQSTISKWLLRNRIPETENLIKLSQVLKCSVEYLLGRED